MEWCGVWRVGRRTSHLPGAAEQDVECGVFGVCTSVDCGVHGVAHLPSTGCSMSQKRSVGCIVWSSVECGSAPSIHRVQHEAYGQLMPAARDRRLLSAATVGPGSLVPSSPRNDSSIRHG